MYSTIPMPRFEAGDDEIKSALAFFPLAGFVTGILIFALNTCPVVSEFPVAVRILITMAIPFIITGGIHVDGFMDTEDALRCYGTCEKKLDILKDPHIGAFAVISLVKLLLIHGAAVTAILLSEKTDPDVLIIFAMSFVVSRCVSALTSLKFKKARKEGMLYGVTAGASGMVVLLPVLQLAAAGSVMLYLRPACFAPLFSVLGLFTLYYRHMAYKQFGGVTGDTAGWFLTVSETMMAAVLALVLYIF